ncbi:hypothetical protein [Flavobacterium sp. ZS1P14]|uniref:hypothetical protein n=1 Tax=Flavobacterium sp. ZS1P14 TaxID=3401729 RepID=UPI003AAC735E
MIDKAKMFAEEIIMINKTKASKRYTFDKVWSSAENLLNLMLENLCISQVSNTKN